MSYVYPSSALDNPEALIDIVGTYWSSAYAGKLLLGDVLSARARLDVQTLQDLDELRRACSRFSAPIDHVDNWYCLRLLQSAQRTDVNLVRYDGTLAFTDPAAATFGTSTQSNYYAWPLPPGLGDVLVVTNRLSNASLVWMRGIDYVLKDDCICFYQNPFANKLVSTSNVFDTSTPDMACTLWLYRSCWDQQTLYALYGSVLGVQAASSSCYRDFLNAAWDALVQGTTQSAVERVLAALCDAPLVLGAETVVQISTDNSYLWIITDQHAYRYSQAAVPIVSVGQSVQPGQALTDVVSFFEFGHGDVPEELGALSLGAGFLSSGYQGELVFANTTTPLVVTENVDGYTKVACALGGLPGDVHQFWDDVHARGVAQGRTLAMMLDTRANKNGQPTAAALPSTIKPLELLIQNVWRANLCLAVVRPQAMGPLALGLGQAGVLRQVVPPHTCLLLLVTLLSTGDQLSMGRAGTSVPPRYSETVNTYLGTTTTDTIAAWYRISERVRAVLVPGYFV